MNIRLTDERRQAIAESFARFCAQEFDDEPSAYRAERTLEFFVSALGPSVYNQAIQDARGFVHERLEELDGEFYVPENPLP